MDGVVAASGWPASRAFFLVYYLIAVVVIFNLVIAYVLERYDEQVGRKSRPFLSPFPTLIFLNFRLISVGDLPRQARDRREEKSTKTPFRFTHQVEFSLARLEAEFGAKNTPFLSRFYI
jgi:hypothetical protein